ncbi:MAG: hypothetical protein IPM61_12060 [Chlorobi bacterium]|nr:MAG: hypothetical protein UZ07_CHB004001764 [Chlorobi bacterium OLB7]MBK8912047.1 hypothetical protein [Chlorobiota bacterium]MCE7935407.1 hypothetical protein [Chlorobi bacterium CHB2]
MKQSQRATQLLMAMLAMLTIAGCTNYGTKLEFKKGELYYTENTTEADAKKLGDYLLAQGYFDDTETRTVQLDKKDGTHHVRFVVKEEYQTSPKALELFTPIGAELSKAVFGGAKIVVDICDETLETKQTLSASGDQPA